MHRPRDPHNKSTDTLDERLALQLVAAFVFQHLLTPTEPVQPLSVWGSALIVYILLQLADPSRLW